MRFRDFVESACFVFGCTCLGSVVVTGSVRMLALAAVFFGMWARAVVR